MNDIVVRAAKTFVQAFLATWAVTGNQVTRNALVAAVAAAVSAVWNVVLVKKG